MGKIAKVQEVPIVKLKPYENNAKLHGKEQIERLKASIEEFGFVSPCLIDENYNLIAGHGRVEAAKDIGMKNVPCVFVEGLTEAQRRAYILADNKLGELGAWDTDIIDAELLGLNDIGFDVSLTGFELPEINDWFETRERFDRSKEEGNEEYNDFLEKFEDKKTTDDCYTPDNIYDVIAEYVVEQYGVKREDFVRPFYPGGDYENERYGPEAVVVDNPPFSILSKIVDFYVEKGVKFFLFAPGVATLGYTSRPTVSAICCHAQVTYENGARVPTNFVTNLGDGKIAAMSDPDLMLKINEANKINEAALHRDLPKYEYPFNVITSARLGWLAVHGEKLTIKKDDCVVIDALDLQKELGKGIFGKGLLMSEQAAAERAAAERAAAERAAATTWELSERELEIVRSLGKGAKE